MMENELKPCPFCGGEAKLVGTSVYWVECSKCRAGAFNYAIRSMAIAAWNARAGNGADHFVDANKMMPPPEYVRQIPANGVRYVFAERENGRCFWCVDSKEEALQLAANLLRIAELYERPVTEAY